LLSFPLLLHLALALFASLLLFALALFVGEALCLRGGIALHAESERQRWGGQQAQGNANTVTLSQRDPSTRHAAPPV
jgi:hypothetical protein